MLAKTDSIQNNIYESGPIPADAFAAAAAPELDAADLATAFLA